MGRARRPRHARGYTLIEIMAAVAIVGILAALAITGYKKYFGSASSAEARGMLEGIRAAQFMAMSDRLTYESCSLTFATPSSWYPSGGSNGQKWDWDRGAGHLESACWSRLNIRPAGPVRYGYATVSGVGATIPNIPVITAQPTVPSLATGEPWFVVAASADLNQNSVRSMFWASSWDKQINVFQENE